MVDASRLLAGLEELLAGSAEKGQVPDRDTAKVVLDHVARLDEISGGTSSDRPQARSKNVSRPHRPEPKIQSNGLPAAENVATCIYPPLAFMPFDNATEPLPVFVPEAFDFGDDLAANRAEIERMGDADGISVGELTNKIVTGEAVYDIEDPEDDLTAAWASEFKSLTGEQPAVVTGEQPAIVTGEQPTIDDDLPLPAPVAEELEPEPHPAEVTAPVADSERPVVYLLSDHRPIVLLDELESYYEVQFFKRLDDFNEMLTAVIPDALIVAGKYFDELATLGPVVEKSRRRKHGRALPFFVLANEDSIERRLATLRAGADALLRADTPTRELRRRLDELLAHGEEEPFRVLVIEDDQSQSLLTSKVLSKAGMQTEVQPDPLAILASLEKTQPDLILMDLHMPGCDGMELTTIIREHPRFMHTPIVFLSGESDTDKQFDAIQAGGDDFLSKPVRPKHLISAVTNRIRRARALAARQNIGASKQDPATGLYDRQHLLEQINAALLALPPSTERPGGIVFAEIDDSTSIKRQFGVTGLDTVSRQVGSLMTEHLHSGDVACYYAGGVFVLLLKDRQIGDLRRVGQRAIEQVSRAQVGIADRFLQASISIGICPLSQQFADAGALVAAAERSAAQGAPTRGRLVLHELAKADLQAMEDEALAISLRQAIKQNQLQVVYQPVVSLHGEKREMYQSLVRLPDDNGQSLTAGKFIATAERAGLIAHIDRQMLARAVAVLDRRQRKNRDTRLFVSQSARLDQDPKRKPWLAQLIQLRSVRPDSLILEFQLSQLIDNELALEHIEQLRELGVSISLAGMDGGPRKMGLIKQLRPQFIKLTPLGAIKSDVDLKAVVQRLHDLQAKVIMPVVEDARTAASLWSYDVDFIQGNFVQPPEPKLAYQFAAD